jgi:hypothetical protein
MPPRVVGQPAVRYEIRAMVDRADLSPSLLMGLFVPLLPMLYCGSSMLARLAGMLLRFVVVAGFMMSGRCMVVLGGLVMLLRGIGMML